MLDIFMYKPLLYNIQNCRKTPPESLNNFYKLNNIVEGIIRSELT